jgi:hypothetical protein
MRKAPRSAVTRTPASVGQPDRLTDQDETGDLDQRHDGEQREEDASHVDFPALGFSAVRPIVNWFAGEALPIYRP